MTGILAALRAGKFTCYGPAGVDETDLLATPDESDTTPPRGKFLETSRPDRLFLPVPPIFDDDPLLFGFFIDGSIEFYTDMNRHQEAFRNVVGVAKSFDLHRTLPHWPEPGAGWRADFAATTRTQDASTWNATSQSDHCLVVSAPARSESHDQP